MAEAKSDSRIAGSIRSISGTPLRDAVIKVFQDARKGETLLVTRSDSRGYFRSADLDPGDYYLEVTRPGYKPLTTNRLTIIPGQTISLEIILQEFMDYISDDEDPRNWSLKTVMRSSSDRRLIFRDLPGEPWLGAENQEAPFSRSGAMSIASHAPKNGASYWTRPYSSQTGVSSNFAFSEPVSPHSRMILSGQLDFGNGSFWRLRNTYNYRPDDSHDYRISVGYGQMDVSHPATHSIPPPVLTRDSDWGESAVETLALGLEGTTRLLDLVAVHYGFDYSRLHYGVSKSFFYPSLQILIAPVDGWLVQTSFTSRRLSDSNSVMLPDGEIYDLAEPTFLTMVGNRVSMSQVRHSEISVRKALEQDTDIELAVYQDNIRGPGLPLLVTTVTPQESRTDVVELGEDHSSQRGLRVAVYRKIMNHLAGSIAYGYGTAASISSIDDPVTLRSPDSALLSYACRRYQHAITGRIDATVPLTKTNLLATVRWYPGNPLTPIDWFSDRMDIGINSANLEIRQSLPLPESVGNAGHWEILVDLRNIFNQGREIIPTTDGEIVLNRNPRSLRFGLNFNFR